MNKELTYISLFSSAGVGCYGFQLENFACIATAEFIKRRLDVQRHNNKCRYDSGYISDDLTSPSAIEKIRTEFKMWERKHGIKDLDVLLATPPCQGMSVANHKKNDELGRNSLVVESITMVNEYKPKVFVFENVKAFLTTLCTDRDGIDRPIKDTIELNLAKNYHIKFKVLNFKDYGSKSSRTRTLVIGTRKDLRDLNPDQLMPGEEASPNLREIIGSLPELKNAGEVWGADIYHSFRPYAPHMLSWIKDTTEGQSAFDQSDPLKRPHRIIDGQIVYNQNKNGDKYQRCYWDKVAPCVHTRNDILASQATIHPHDNRVFSVRELMIMMSIPGSFKWSKYDTQELNNMKLADKQAYLAKEEPNIRQSIGEAVPTAIFQKIASNIRDALKNTNQKQPNLADVVLTNALDDTHNMVSYIKEHPEANFVELSRLVEYANARRSENAAYYTSQDVCYSLIDKLPSYKSDRHLRLLEPSVGAGNFIPTLIEKYKHIQNVQLDLMDIDENAITILKQLIQRLSFPKGWVVNCITDDFITHKFDQRYDFIIGNPPFLKLTGNKNLLAKYRSVTGDSVSNNLFAFFLAKALMTADGVAFVGPKSFLSAPEFSYARGLSASMGLTQLSDYGEFAFPEVKIETISIVVESKAINTDGYTRVTSYPLREIRVQPTDYITDPTLPYWVIYRDSFFDYVANGLVLDVFRAFRDRQLTKKHTKPEGLVRVLKSRNIGPNRIINIENYDSYIDDLSGIAVAKFLNHKAAVAVPNLSYYPRAVSLPAGAIADGSVAILVSKDDLHITDEQLKYFSTEEFFKFYRVARNYGTRSLNIDSSSVFFWGLPKRSKVVDGRQLVGGAERAKLLHVRS